MLIVLEWKEEVLNNIKFRAEQRAQTLRLISVVQPCAPLSHGVAFLPKQLLVGFRYLQPSTFAFVRIILLVSCQDSRQQCHRKYQSSNHLKKTAAIRRETIYVRFRPDVAIEQYPLRVALDFPRIFHMFRELVSSRYEAWIKWFGAQIFTQRIHPKELHSMIPTKQPSPINIFPK